MNIITFGKYKGMPVTRVLRIDLSYFGWCKNNVRWFKFSKRDYEIYFGMVIFTTKSFAIHRIF